MKRNTNKCHPFSASVILITFTWSLLVVRLSPSCVLRCMPFAIVACCWLSSKHWCLSMCSSKHNFLISSGPTTRIAFALSWLKARHYCDALNQKWQIVNVVHVPQIHKPIFLVYGISLRTFSNHCTRTRHFQSE